MAGAEDVDAAVACAKRALTSSGWADASPAHRAAVLERAARLLEAHAERFAQAESADTGKPLNLARRLDVPRAVANFDFFAQLVQHGELDVVRHGGGADRALHDSALNYSVRRPVGVVGLVTPWNLPLCELPGRASNPRLVVQRKYQK